MSEMVERVAIALMDTTTEPHFPWDDQPEEIKTRWRFAARAAIAAMREPTDAMRCAGLYCGPWRADSTENPKGPWRRMIDAALKPCG